MSLQPMPLRGAVKLAEANGCVGLRVEKNAELRPALERALQVGDRPTVIDFLVEEAEDCWPMIAPGKAHDQLIGTYDSLKHAGGIPQHRHVDPDDEAKLSLG